MSRMSIADTSNIVNINQDQRKTPNTYRLTGNQKMVYETLLNLKRSAGAYELLDILRKKGVNAAATVYRALNELSGKGLVKRIVSTRTFIAHQRPKSQSEETLMLICKHCGEVSSIDDQKLVGMFDKNISQSGYHVNSYHLELIVSCDGCNKKNLN
ncbi:MAG: transcriptional repressor [Emcibacteraceae bacterium]|nr:transcriptional repressor [Emcibacteraceae bacterium]